MHDDPSVHIRQKPGLVKIFAFGCEKNKKNFPV